MQISFFQIVLTVIAGSFLANGLRKFFRKAQNQTLFKITYTILIWGGIIILTLLPDLTRDLSIKFGLGESLNTLIFIGFVLVFMAIFKLLNSIERIESGVTELIRKEALKDLDKYIDETGDGIEGCK